MFIRHSHWLTIPSSLAPRQNDVICLNLHSRFGLFLSERVLCQSSFAQRDYSQCTYSQTTANGIAGVINELNHSYTITYTAFTCHTPGSKYELTIEVASLMPAMPFPCAKAEAVAAMKSAADRIAFLFFKMFLFMNCPCFLPSKGWIVLCRAVVTLLLYFGFSGCPFVSTDVGVSVADGIRLAFPCRVG